MTKNKQQYCVYKNALSDDLSLEHVIPLSLGGHNSFCIQADRITNNALGSQVDAPVANDFFIMLDRQKHDMRGHSKSPPVPVAKHSTFEEQKMQVAFNRDGLSLFDVRKRKTLPPEQFSGKTINVGGIHISLDAFMRFTAKSALSAGYFAYGSQFIDQVDHEQARIIMSASSLELINPDVRVFDRFSQVEDDTHLIMRLLLTQYAHSGVLLIPGYDCFGVAVGILGNFIGFINIPAPGHSLPNCGDFDLGHVVFNQGGTLVRRSFRAATAVLAEDLENGDDSLMAAIALHSLDREA
jgi:hypothetical protein